MSVRKTIACSFLVLAASGILPAQSPGPADSGAAAWAFAAMSDPRPGKYRRGLGDDLDFYRTTLLEGATAARPRPELLLMIGDMDPVDVCDQVIAGKLGADYPWIPVIGNHDLESRRHIPKILERFDLGLEWGPDGTRDYQFHFTRKGVLFLCVNPYWNGKTGPGAEVANRKGSAPDANIVPENLARLREVLAGSQASWKLTFGHEPAWPFGRHTSTSLADHPENRDRFWKLLDEMGSQIFFCGHTHQYSTYQWLGNRHRGRWDEYRSSLIPEASGVWQVDAGCVRGREDDCDRTIVYLKVTPERIEVHTYRSAYLGGDRHGPWVVPENDLREDPPVYYRIDVRPEVGKNLPEAGAGEIAASRDAEVLLDCGPRWKYFEGRREPSPGPDGGPTTSWARVDFDDGGKDWLEGSTGIGYGDGDDATVLDDMRGSHLSVYLRRKLTLADLGITRPEEIGGLLLTVHYDDGFVAYLNGTEIGRSESMRGEGEPPRYRDDADDEHEFDEEPATIALGGFLELFDPAGVNVLAFQVHNSDRDSTDLSLQPRIVRPKS